MRVEDIPAYEQDFNERRIDSEGKLHTLTQRRVQIPNEHSFMEYIIAQPANGDRTYFYNEEISKDQIVLHYTMKFKIIHRDK